MIELQDQSKKFRDQLEIMRSPRYLEARIKELNLGLAQPAPAQIWRLNEHPLPPHPAGPQEYPAEQGLASAPQ